jgi:hypothetical protein
MAGNTAANPAQPADPQLQPVKETVMNPFFTEWTTPHGMPPFDQIRPEHYRPAFERAMKMQKDIIASIVANAEAPTFANTIEPFEYSGMELDRVGNVSSWSPPQTPTTNCKTSARKSCLCSRGTRTHLPRRKTFRAHQAGMTTSKP